MKQKLHGIIFIQLIIFILLSGHVAAQTLGDTYVKKGDFIVTTGYGFPSALRIYLKREKPDEDLNIRGYGPAHLKLEYMLLKKLTVGISGFYSYSDVYWQANAQALDGTMQPFRHGVQVWEAAAGLRLNYYFYQKRSINFYAGAGAGIGYANAETYTFSPKERIYINHTFPPPFNFEATVGGRLFLSKNIGIYTELGVGQSWLLYNYYFIPASIFQFGLTVKL